MRGAYSQFSIYRALRLSPPRLRAVCEAAETHALFFLTISTADRVLWKLQHTGSRAEWSLADLARACHTSSSFLEKRWLSPQSDKPRPTLYLEQFLLFLEAVLTYTNPADHAGLIGDIPHLRRNVRATMYAAAIPTYEAALELPHLGSADTKQRSVIRQTAPLADTDVHLLRSAVDCTPRPLREPTVEDIPNYHLRSLRDTLVQRHSARTARLAEGHLDSLLERFLLPTIRLQRWMTHGLFDSLWGPIVSLLRHWKLATADAPVPWDELEFVPATLAGGPRDSAGFSVHPMAALVLSIFEDPDHVSRNAAGRKMLRISSRFRELMAEQEAAAREIQEQLSTLSEADLQALCSLYPGENVSWDSVFGRGLGTVSEEQRSLVTEELRDPSSDFSRARAALQQLDAMHAPIAEEHDTEADLERRLERARELDLFRQQFASSSFPTRTRRVRNRA